MKRYEEHEPMDMRRTLLIGVIVFIVGLLLLLGLQELWNYWTRDFLAAQRAANAAAASQQAEHDPNYPLIITH